MFVSKEPSQSIVVTAHWVKLFCFPVSASKTLKVIGPQGMSHHDRHQLAEEVPASWAGGLKADPQEKPVVKEVSGGRDFKLGLAQHKTHKCNLKSPNNSPGVCVRKHGCLETDKDGSSLGSVHWSQ